MITSHPLGIMNIRIKFHGNPSNSWNRLKYVSMEQSGGPILPSPEQRTLAWLKMFQKSSPTFYGHFIATDSYDITTDNQRWKGNSLANVAA